MKNIFSKRVLDPTLDKEKVVTEIGSDYDLDFLKNGKPSEFKFKIKSENDKLIDSLEQDNFFRKSNEIIHLDGTPIIPEGGTYSPTKLFYNFKPWFKWYHKYLYRTAFGWIIVVLWGGNERRVFCLYRAKGLFDAIKYMGLFSQTYKEIKHSLKKKLKKKI